MTHVPQAPSDLLADAQAAWRSAYAPYSGFRVGAALRSTREHVYRGANVENASYGLSICAERAAVCAMIAAGDVGFVEVLVYTEAEEPASPCGACRQVLFEFGREAWVHLVNQHGLVHTLRVSELLPHGFSLAAATATDRLG